MRFREWLNLKDTSVNQQDIDTIYDHCKISVQLVRMYRPELLYNINTIANLASGAFGLYASAENTNILDPSTEQRLIYRTQGKMTLHQIRTLPQKILKQSFPDLKQGELKSGNTIHVNVRKILAQSKNDLDAVLQIASTICHEAQHVKDHEETGYSSETAPMAVEQKFMAWAQQNLDKIRQQIGM